MNTEEILKFAQKSIYDTVDRLGDWRGYEVWEPGFSDDKDHCIGFPMFILVKGDTIRWTKDWKESQTIMWQFYKSEEDD